jgi:hypothetical protein
MNNQQHNIIGNILVANGAAQNNPIYNENSGADLLIGAPEEIDAVLDSQIEITSSFRIGNRHLAGATKLHKP